MPVVLLGLGIPGPVGFLGVGKNDARAGIFLIGVAPHVEVALGRTLRGQAGALEPGMLVGGVIDDQLNHHLQAAVMRLGQELPEVLHGAVVGVHAEVVGDIVAVIAQGRGEERKQPQASNAQVLQVVELTE